MTTRNNPLVGKTLTGVSIAKDREAILFHTTEGDIKVLADADCCSYTWIEAIELPARGFPAVVLSVEDLNMPEKEGPSEYCPNPDVLAFYGCKISTDMGDMVIDYRNDSNGYYGGNLVWPGEYFYGGVYNQNASSEEWEAVAQG